MSLGPIGGGWPYCSGKRTSPTALVHIAQAKGYFLEEGIDMEIKDYSAGKFALAALLRGELDVGTVADLPIVLNSFERDGQLRTI